MKKICLILIFIASIAVAVTAQTKQTEQAKAWKTFQTAIAENDKHKVAALVQFPFEASIAPENLNFRIETEADFLKNYDSVFNRTRRKKIVRGKLVSVPGEDEFNFEMLENGSYQVFTFRKIGKKYLLVGTMSAG